MSDYISDLRQEMLVRLKEINRQLGAVQELIDERDRIEAALQQPPFVERATSRRPRKPRARRGENREKILGAVDERPGATATTIAQVTGIARPTTYTTLGKLAEQGAVAKEELPGGQIGYRLKGRLSDDNRADIVARATSSG